MVEGQKEPKAQRKPRAKKNIEETQDFQPIEKVTEIKQEKPAKVSKIVEVEAQKVEIIEPRPKVFPVLVNGKVRNLNQLSIDVLSKDPSFILEIPEGSPLVIPKDKPCKDC